MRPQCASLLGGFSVAIIYRYLDIGLIYRWNFGDRGPASPLSTPDTPARSRATTHTLSDGTVFEQLKYGWYTLWSFCHVNTPYEVKNVPRFSRYDPTYVPSGHRFVLKQISTAAACYVFLDLLGQERPP
ncbi:hypothetical protein P171DRAFT_430269 [Karstenula rhodostoma CBS 690.94]|uniref:Uncharacterized protein n=1 Tax=Karstenula rhodostoma CBS 690.94 TaxID=1392251 RepID=A0A9P4PJ51_9PLEO|nr:hypothetical protein P171DRAFT_430269 [Karstenula rhodostoma CBS 690.94]